MPKPVDLEQVVAWAKRRGFVFPASDIYGGLANTYDYGPYGTQLKKNIQDLWWKRFIQEREDIYGIDSTIILRPEVWEASGHTASFADVMVEDAVTHKRYRADHLVEEHYFKKGEEYNAGALGPEELDKLIAELKIKSPDGNPLGSSRRFNQLFETEIGIIAGAKNKAYLRGEIAQGLFMNFKNIRDSFSPKLPFGIGQAGKAFRNEITPGKFIFRTLEFDLMEFEYFFDPAHNNWEELYDYWQKEIYEFALEIGLKEEDLRWRPHTEDELSHYSKRTEDLEFKFPWGFKEMWALAYRTDFDLRNHTEKSGKDLSYIYADGSRVIPHVVEPTFGLSRTASILMFAAYTEEELPDGQSRVVMKFPAKIAPVTVAVLALQKDERLEAAAREIFNALKKDFVVEYESKGNIGKMYRRHDEIGTPMCLTVDYETLDDKMVTVRDRDTMEQKRVAISDLANHITKTLDI
jgi:glycyl-tRNA synthetase